MYALDDEADEYVVYAVDSAERTGEMFDGLLTYSRVKTRGAELDETDGTGMGWRYANGSSLATTAISGSNHLTKTGSTSRSRKTTEPDDDSETVAGVAFVRPGAEPVIVRWPVRSNG